MIRVLIVDDEAIVRHGLRTILETAGDIHIVGEASTGEEAIKQVRALAPDIVLMDIRMPHTDGLAATKEIAAVPGAPQVIVLTTFALDEYVDEAMYAGAVGFLVKDTAPMDLIEGVRAVANGHAVLSPPILRRVVDQLHRQAPRVGAEDLLRLETLTEREREVLTLVAAGLSNNEIADNLFMSVATVKVHVSKVLAKLGTDNRVQAAVLAHDAGLDGANPGAPLARRTRGLSSPD